MQLNKVRKIYVFTKAQNLEFTNFCAFLLLESYFLPIIKAVEII